MKSALECKWHKSIKDIRIVFTCLVKYSAVLLHMIGRVAWYPS